MPLGAKCILASEFLTGIYLHVSNIYVMYVMYVHEEMTAYLYIFSDASENMALSTFHSAVCLLGFNELLHYGLQMGLQSVANQQAQSGGHISSLTCSLGRLLGVLKEMRSKIISTENRVCLCVPTEARDNTHLWSIRGPACLIVQKQ